MVCPCFGNFITSAWELLAKYPWQELQVRLASAVFESILFSIVVPQLKGHVPLFMWGQTYTINRQPWSDKLNDERYIASRKLGYGQYSTAWLARDLSIELEMLRHIQQKSHLSTNPGRSHVISHLDHFHHRGANGNHVCFVLPVMGHHLGLQATKFEQQRIPVLVMKEVARHLLKGLNFHPENAALYTQPLNMRLELDNPGAAISRYLQQTSVRNSQPTRTRLGDIDTGSETTEIPMPLTEVNNHHSTTLRNGEHPCEDYRLLGLTYVTRSGHRNSVIQVQDASFGHADLFFIFPSGNLLRIPKAWPASLLSLLDGKDEIVRKPKGMPYDEVPIFVDLLEGMLAVELGNRNSAAMACYREYHLKWKSELDLRQDINKLGTVGRVSGGED
ncbi:hypothetical protein ACJ72_06984 [Emergomyces africanus]|uniref:non-specific serine/threonine protein kinase n=1 Tax=Emergomyces africanus TaxID=1955775 RepID=A0A1B7NPW8_9EURO|nr:hypothetical protein ACJ72_06984 [Emergomyces africanus]